MDEVELVVLWCNWEKEMVTLDILDSPSSSVRLTIMLRLHQAWDDASDSALIENNRVTWKWVTTPIWSNSLVVNENSVASIIAELSKGERSQIGTIQTIRYIGARSPLKVTDMQPISSRNQTANDTCHRCIFKAKYSTVQGSSPSLLVLRAQCLRLSLDLDKLYIVSAINQYQLYPN